jgi:glycyl-tRNA synthetase
VPSVIEPSFGIGRILYAIFEHSFKMRDEKRTYLNLPPRIAPVKCSILTVQNMPDFAPFIEKLSKILMI